MATLHRNSSYVRSREASNLCCVCVCAWSACVRAHSRNYMDVCMHPRTRACRHPQTDRQIKTHHTNHLKPTHLNSHKRAKIKTCIRACMGARDQARPSGEKGRTPLSTPARFPRDMIPTFTPSTSSRNCPTTNLPPTTPIEPVSVPGCATIADAGALKKYLCAPCVRAHRSCCTYTCMRACVHASVSRTHVPQNINMWRREAT